MFLALILAAPVLIVLAITAPIIAICSIPALLLVIYRNPLPPQGRTTKTRLSGKGNKSSSKRKNPTTNNSIKYEDDDDDDDRRQVILTGVYTGVGMAIAKECANIELHPDVKRIVLIAGSQEKLDAATEAILDVNPNMDILCINASPYDPKEMEEAAEEIFSSDNDEDDDDDDDDDNDTYKTTNLFCCAGESYIGLYQDTPTDEYGKLTEVNQLGYVYPTQAFLPHIEAGTVTLMSSLSGQMGLYGCSAYAPTQFALTGFAQCLHMELCYNPVRMQIAYPPDLDVPEREMKKRKFSFCHVEETVPATFSQKILHRLSELMEKILAKMLNLQDPDRPLDADDIAKITVEKAFSEDPPFAVYYTIQGWWLSTLTSGLAPCSTMFDAMSQVACMGFYRFLSLFFLQSIYEQIKEDSKRNSSSVLKSKFNQYDDDNVDNNSIPETENSFQSDSGKHV